VPVEFDEWASAERFDYEGEFYRVKGALSSVRPAAGRLPIYFGGASEDAIRVGGRHADVYAFWGEPLDGIRQRIRRGAGVGRGGRAHDRPVLRQPPSDRGRHRGGSLGAGPRHSRAHPGAGGRLRRPAQHRRI
jgi:alkanesulfonate monooxygenase SsuD/methylene tetrahydromethanopterin reductase-like flavin-dependent oxidoreductase (luciferase family)